MKKSFQGGGPAPSESMALQMDLVGQLLTKLGFQIASVTSNYNVGVGGASEFKSILYLNQEYMIGVEVTSAGKVALVSARQMETEYLSIERGTALVIPNTLFFEQPQLIIDFVQALVGGKKSQPAKSNTLN